ncbi:MAG: choice-of-anchor J domain-containing protein [Bacteroidales bacterium]|nr:choice-of-anchor J domain-containing protein [Bacteroidales bacterium]
MKKRILLVVLSVICSMAFAQIQTKPQWTKVTSDSPETFKTQLLSSSENSIKVNVQVGGFYTSTVTTPRGEAKVISVPKSVSTAHAGEPDMPMTGIPLMIGDKARMAARVIDAQYMDFEGIEVAPSKGDFSRQIDPAKVPYTYGECYEKDAFFPASNLDLYEPYIIRDFRGQNMAVYPFAYNPVSKTLRVYYNMTVEMYKVDNNGKNVIETRRGNEVKMDPDFKSVYQRHFINFEESAAKYTVLDEDGDLLIICYDNFISSMTDFVNWKKTRGVNTTIVGTSTAGSTYSAIQTYIRNQYNANNNLTHVLLVGDVAQIPGYTFTDGGSSWSGKGDNQYGQIVGNDIYNDVIIGRFSASSDAQVTTQVNRTITYERDLTTSDTWCQNGLGISASAGSGGHYNEDDYQHIENLRTDLLNYGYNTVYQDYKSVSGYPSSSTTTISNHINSGVGIINYCNHGEETGWQSHYYMNSNVNALTNNNKLPFIFSVACLVGKYDYSSGDCFAETWMHATNSNTPSGAVCGAFSYISQPWIPPMWAQDEFVDILVESYNNNIKRSFGGAAINGMMAIFDNYSTTETSAVGCYKAWVVYGDPTLMMRTKTPQAMNVTHSGTLPMGTSTYSVSVSNGVGAVATITDANHNILGKATVGSNGTANIAINGTLTAGTDLTLCVFGYNKVTYLGTIQVVSNDAPFITVDSYTPTSAHVGDNTDLSITFKNVGNQATTGTTTVTLSAPDSNVTFSTYTKTFNALAANATTTVSGFKFNINTSVADNTDVTLHYKAVNGSNTWEGDFTVTATAAALEYTGMSWDGSYTPGQTLTVNAKFKNTGHYQATNAVAKIASTSNYISFASSTVNVGTIAVGQEVTIPFSVTIAANCPESSQIPITFTMTADGSLSVTGNETLKNTCNLYFNLADSYGDGWNNASLKVSFSDGTAAQTLTISSGSSASYTIEVGNGTHVTLTWTSGNYDGECSFSVSYDGDLVIYQTNGTPSTGVLYEFDCNCAAASATFNVNVSTNNNGGTVTGGGEFSYGQSCTVNATANTGYYFTGWTNNGTTVSNSAHFTFNVTSDMDLVANFIQALEIGTSASTNNFLPTYNYYKYSFTEQIYTANEIGMAGTISSIAFYNSGTEKTRTLDVYLKSTTKSAFSSKTDWVSMSSSDKVFSGSVTMAAGSWTFINFSTPFEYDGNSNIVLAVDDNSNAYTSAPHMACSVYDANGNQSIYIYSDGTNYNPSSPTTSQSSNYAVLTVKNHILMGITPITGEQYTIEASANPTAGGTVTGAGTYYENGTCTLNATPNTNYVFANWTKDGEVVSTSASYSFTVTEDAEYVANFNLINTVKIMPNDPEYGSVAFGRNRETLTYDFEDGWQGWTSFQGSTTSPHSWMHNTEYTAYDSNGNQIVPECHNSSYGMMLSESYISAATSGGSGTAVTPDNWLVSPQFRLGGSMTFYAASRMSNYYAEKFSVLVSESGNSSASDFTHTELTVTLSSNSWNEYTIDLSAYSGMGYVAIRHFDCNDQHLLYVDDVTIVEGEVSDGSLTASYVNGTSCTVLATPNEGYHLVNWTENGNVVSTNATYTFTVTGDRDLVANFSDQPATTSQTFNLAQGWSWWSTYLDITLEDLQTALVAALPGTQITIKSQNNGSTIYYVSSNQWRGALESLDVAQMYEIYVSAACTITLNGAPVDPTEHPVTVHNGTNWIGFPHSESMSLNDAFDFTPTNGDILKSKNNGSTIYTNGQWRGELTTLVPGQGYIYTSKASGSK